MSYPSWIAPDEKDIENNRAVEPEGERLRRELTDWLERNRICGILMDTTHHHVDIAFGPNLPNEIRSKLSIWGSIYVVISDEVNWRAQRESEQPEQVAKLTDKILTKLFKQYSGKQFKSFRHALRRTLEPIMRAALSPQTDSLSNQQGGPQHG